MRFFPIALLLLAACSHTVYRAPLSVPDQGGPVWTEIGSAHFRVYTDLPLDVAVRDSRTLEETYAAFEKLLTVGMVARAAPTGRVDLVVFDRKEDFLAVSPLETAQALFDDRRIEIEPQPTIVSWGELREGARVVLQHELAHRFIRHTIRFAPLWFNEGLAEYFSTFELFAGLARFGKRPLHGLLRWAGEGADHLPPLEKLLALDWKTFHAPADERQNYLAGWALVHYLEHTPDLRPRFRDYQRRLANGEEPQPAFDAAFEGVDRARIDREYREQAVAPGVSVLEGQFNTTVAAQVTSRKLDTAEVHLLFARTLAWNRANQNRIREQLDRAASLQPGSGEVANLRAWFELRSGHVAQAEEAAQRAVALAPSQPHFQFTLAQMLYLKARLAPPPRDYKPVRALLKPLWPAADSSATLNFLGWLYAEMGEPDMALPFARKAVDLDPACFVCLDTLARILSDTGFVEEALPLQERAVALLPEKVRIPDYYKRLEMLRAAVRAQKATP